MSHLGHSLGGGYPSAEIQSVYSVTTPLASRHPTISKLLNFSWPVIHQVFFSHFRLGVSLISLRPHKIKPRWWKKKEQANKHGLGSAPSARKGVCDTLHSPCICRLSQACILRETSTKAAWNANSSSLTASFFWPSFPGLLSRADRPRLLSVVDCLSLSSFCQLTLYLLYLLWDLPFLVHFRSRGRSCC